MWMKKIIISIYRHIVRFLYIINWDIEYNIFLMLISIIIIIFLGYNERDKNCSLYKIS